MRNRRVASLWGIGCAIVVPLCAACGGNTSDNPDASDGSSPVDTYVPDVKPQDAPPEHHEAAPKGIPITAIVPTGEGSILSTDHQINCGFGGSCVGYYQLDDILMLSEVRGIEYLFKGWGGACASSGTNTSCVLTVTGPATISVAYEVPPLVPVTVSVTGGRGMVTSMPMGIATSGTQTASFPEGTGMMLTASPTSSSDMFIMWVGGQCGTGANASMPMCSFGLGATLDTESAMFGPCTGYSCYP
jgi:hypothetical protein